MKKPKKNAKAEISDEDITTVIDQANCSREDAIGALEEANGNIAEAIMKLQNK